MSCFILAIFIRAQDLGPRGVCTHTHIGSRPPTNWIHAAFAWDPIGSMPFHARGVGTFAAKAMWCKLSGAS
eukprot:5494387-Pyramimonas_sp.AAC.1